MLLLLAIAAAIALWPAKVDNDQVPASTDGPTDTQASQETELSPADPAATPAALQPATNLLDQQAMNAWYAGEIQDAMALFEQAIDATPDDPAPHSHYGRLLTLMVAYDQALPLLERANDLRPDDAQTWLDLATLYERAQRFEKSWEARAEAERIVGADAIVRDEQGRLIVQGTSLW
ncbi:MAG: tetratricopeptide repeat protein [Gammaproteobacteria bacterium]|nr:tetratricopeptide repeat protein [Gammaproteobacteria bacterium]